MAYDLEWAIWKIEGLLRTTEEQARTINLLKDQVKDLIKEKEQRIQVATSKGENNGN